MRSEDKREIAVVVGLGVAFTVMRLLGLGRVYLWDDDILTLGPYLDAPTSEAFRAITWEAAFGITGPALPTLLYRWLITYVLGDLNPFVLRLVPLGAGLLSFVLLYVISRRLFEPPAVRIVLLVLFTVMTPSVLFSRQIQPSMFYALATFIQLYVYIRLMEADPWQGGPVLWAKQLAVLGVVAAVVHFFNYVSVAVTCILMAHYLLGIYINGGTTTDRLRRAAISGGMAAVALVPIALLSYDRITSGLSVRRPYFDPYYYIDSLLDPLWLSYDTLTYTFNFVYDPRLYTPLGANLLGLPFVIVCLLGLVAFALKREEHALGFVVGFVFMGLLSALKFYPLGGVRHSLMLTPFFLLSFGYGLTWLGVLLRDRVALRTLAAGFGAVAVLLFTLSGRQVYGWREARIDVGEVAALAAANDVEQIVAVSFTYEILYMLDVDDHLEGYTIERLREGDTPPRDAPYLLVHHRYVLPESAPIFDAGGDVRFSREELGGQVVALREERGPLPQYEGPQAVSIYAPPNGMFVYLVTPSAGP